jgi:RNA polymerase sigma factor (sigma-70 family)
MQVTTDYIERFHNSDPAIMEAIYREHEYSVIRHAYRITKVKEESKDISQRVFTKLWCKRKEFNSETDIRAFLFAHTEWAALDYIKSDKTKAIHHQQIANQNAGTTYETPAVLDNIDIEYGMRILIPAFNQLAPRCRQILQMSYVDKISDENIALRLNMSVKTMQTIRSKGVINLRKKVKETGAQVNFYSFLPLIIILAKGM